MVILIVQTQPFFSTSASLATRALNLIGQWRNLMTVDAYKRQATRLADHLSSVHKVRLKNASALEAIAAVHNCRDWNTLCAEGSAAQEVKCGEQAARQPAPFASAAEASSYLFTRHSFSEPRFCDALLSQTLCIAEGYKEEKRAIVDHLVQRQIARGGGFIYLSNSDISQYHRLRLALKDAGRELQAFLPANLEYTNFFNPLLLKDADVIASVLLTLLPSADNKPGADFYRQQANYVLTVVIGAMQAAAEPITFESLAEYLSRPAETLVSLGERIKGTHAGMALRLLLEEFLKKTKEGTKVDTERFKSVLGGMAGRIALFAQGNFGWTLNPNATQGFTWPDVFDKQHSVFIDTVQYMSSDHTLERLLIASLRGALREARKLAHPPLVILDTPCSSEAATLLASAASAQEAGFIATHPYDLGRGLVARVSATGGFGRSAKVSLDEVEKGFQTHAELHEFKGWPTVA